MSKPSMDDYVDVAERIGLFYEKYPDGRLTRVGEPKIMEVAGKPFVVYTAEAYRTADDPVPAIGTAWEPFPGPTPFTRDSELMNAETAAWGRAIIAAGIGSKKIASKQEVQARQSNGKPEEPKKPAVTISPKTAGVLYSASQRAGVDANRLQLAASHVHGSDVGDCSTEEAALTALQTLTRPDAAKLETWLNGKAAEVADAA